MVCLSLHKLRQQELENEKCIETCFEYLIINKKITVIKGNELIVRKKGREVRKNILYNIYNPPANSKCTHPLLAK